MSNLLNIKQKENTGRNFYVGLIPYTVIAVNPSKEQLVEMLKTENITEPVYLKDGKMRIDVWLENKERNYITKMALWLENKERVANSGNTLFINQKNQTTWGESIEAIANKPTMQWFDTSTARAAYVGEDVLYNFLVTYINADTSEGGIVLDNFQGLLNGDVSELSKIFEHYNNRAIKILTGMKDGRVKYYTRYFVKNEVRSTKGLMNSLEDNPFDAEYTLDGIQQYDMPMRNDSKESTPSEAPVSSSNLF
jgi:hypothetical protein